MTPTITYDGVASAMGGTIFQGKRFWVAIRVPQRSRFIDDIQNNGGVVVPLEKNADYLIADQARKDCPAGSLSYKFIEDSMSNGILQLEDRYRFGRDPEVARPVGHAGLRKASRTPFSTEDDHALAKWVLSHPTNRLGNAIYQDFEAQNPRHTWQSWQNRWKKTLSLLPTDRLEQMAESAPSMPQHQPQQVPQTDGAATTPNRATNHQRAERGEIPKTARSPTRSAQKAEPQPPAAESEAEVVGATQDDEAESSADAVGKGRFYADLAAFAEARQSSVQLQPTIAGRTLELWDLLLAVNSQEASPEDVDWNEVALDLGFVRAIREVTTQLRQCWDDNLADFLEAAVALDDEDSGSSAMVEEDKILGEDLRVGPEVQVELPSSPPASISSRKRSLDEGSAAPSSHHKRRMRFDRNTEIPSTPDEKLGVVRPRPNEEILTGSRRKDATSHIIKDSQDDTQATSAPKTPRIQQPLLGPRLETQESSFDVSPSQQLQQESRMSMTPTPARTTGVDPGRRDEATSSLEPELEAHIGATPELGSRSHQQQHHTAASVSPSTQQSQRSAKPAVRRTLPASFTSTQQPSTTKQERQQEPPPPQPSLREATPDNHDPTNNPDPHPVRRDSPNFDTIEGWIDHYQAMGYPLRAVVAALKSTTLTPGGLASHVMESIVSGQGIPTHDEGVWTDRDDRSLRLVKAASAAATGGESNDEDGLDREPTDAEEHQLLRRARKERARLLNKHGQERMVLRSDYLEAQEQDALAETK